jgi:hypothetical protein
MSGMRWLSALVVFAGCDVVYGLDGRMPVPPDARPECESDRDCDLVLDATDNCVDVSNSDQNDGDRDDIGDVCDPCVARERSATSDSDNDQIVDSIDNCPGARNAGQEDSDGDGVGDMCDEDPDQASRLRCFFGFEDRASVLTTWSVGEGDWTVTSGVLSHFGTDPPHVASLETSGLFADVSAFSIVTTGYSQPVGDVPHEYGIGLGPVGVELGTRCVVTSSGVAFNDTVALIGPDDHIIMSGTTAPTSGTQWTVSMFVQRSSSETRITCRAGTTGDPPIVLAVGGLPTFDGVPVLSLIARNIGASFLDVSIFE